MNKIIRKYRHPKWTKTHPWLILVDSDRNVWLDTGDAHCSLLGRMAPDSSLPVSSSWNRQHHYRLTKANVLKFANV